MYKYSFYIIALLLLCSSCSLKQKRSVSEKQCNDALAYLIEHINYGDSIERIHSTEFLLKLNYQKQVKDSLKYVLPKNNGYSKIDVCYWRVLVELDALNTKRSPWINHIQQALYNNNVEIGIAAAESLAKLGIIQKRWSWEEIKAIDNNRLRTFLQWSMANESPQRKQEVKNCFLSNLISPVNSEIKRLSAYALGTNFTLTSSEWLNVINAEHACTDSLLLKYYTWCAYCVAPKKEENTNTFEETEQQLFKVCSLPDDAFLIFSALAKHATSNVLPYVNDYLKKHANNGCLGGNLSAYYCLLKINKEEPYKLSGLDWGVIILYFITMIVISYNYFKKNKSAEDYILGGKKMNSTAIGLSLFATMLSSLSYLSYPGEMVKFGPIIFCGMLAIPITYWVVGWLVIPKFINEDVKSAYELLEKKLGIGVRMMASLFFLSLRFLWMATIMFATVNTVLSAVVDLSLKAQIAVSCLLVVVTFIYSTLGGLKAVVVTDVVQTVILWMGALLTIIFASIKIGSFVSWIPTEWLPHWSELKWGFSAVDRTTVCNAMLMFFVWQVCTSGSDQMAIQRYLSLRDLKSARHSFGVSLISNVIVKILLGLIGLAMIAYFTLYPQFLADGKSIVDQSDLLFPKFIMLGLPTGISGLVIAGILAAAMSSLSSGLNSSATVISEDFIKRFGKKKMLGHYNELRSIKIISMIVGVIVLLLSVAVSNVQGNLFDIILKVSNLVVAPLFVLFFMALYIPFATQKGTLFAGILSMTTAVAIAFWEIMGIKSLWIMPMSLIVGVCSGIIFSLIERFCILHVGKVK